MNADELKRATGNALSGLLALGLALGLSTGLDAQERTQERQQDRQQDRQEQEISEDEVQDALENADEEIQSLEEHPNLQAQNIKVVRLEDIVDDQQKVSEMQDEHQEGIQKFRTQLQGNRTLSQALQQQNVSAQNVLAVKVQEDQTGEDRPAERGQQQEMAADQPTVYVVVSGTGAAGAQQDRPGREDMAQEDEGQRDREQTDRERDQTDRDPTEAPPEGWPEDRPQADNPEYEDRDQQQADRGQQQGQMTGAHIEGALAEPGLQLHLLEGRDVQSQNVEVVRVEQITDRQKASTMRRDHQHSVQRFQQAIRDNDNLRQALEEQDVSVDDVLAVRATDGTAGQEGQRQEMAADQPTVQVFVFGGAAAQQDARDRDRPGQQQDRGEQQDRDREDDRADRRDREQERDRADRQDTPEQDRPERQQRQQQADRQDQELSEQEIRQALSQPEQQLQSLEQQGDLQSENVKVVKIEDVVDDEQKVSQMRQQNQEGARQFRSELRGNSTLMQALEQENVDMEDVLAVHVKDASDDPRQQREGERTEMAAQQPTVFVIVSDSGTQQDTGGEEGYPPRG